MTVSMRVKHGDVIRIDGEPGMWRVLAAGAVENGATFVHLASVSGGKKQKNGRVCPRQIAGWLRGSALSECP